MNGRNLIPKLPPLEDLPSGDRRVIKKLWVFAMTTYLLDGLAMLDSFLADHRQCMMSDFPEDADRINALMQRIRLEVPRAHKQRITDLMKCTSATNPGKAGG